jgi:hypothetical protein
MAKKPTLKGLFDRTEPSQDQAPQDIIKARGVGLKISEWEELEGIRRELGITLHAVTAYAVRYFLKAYREGKIKPEKRTTQNLPEL